MYKYIALTALALGSAALGFNINRGGDEQFTLNLVEHHENAIGNSARSTLFDINQDGLDDVVKLGNVGATVLLNVRFNLGDTTLSPWTLVGEYPINSDDYDGCSPYSIEFKNTLVVDLNGDTLLDLIVAADWSDVSGLGCWKYVDFYFINNGSGGFTCAGDVTGDGTTDVNDLLGVIGDWGCTDQGLPD